MEIRKPYNYSKRIEHFDKDFYQWQLNKIDFHWNELCTGIQVFCTDYKRLTGKDNFCDICPLWEVCDAVLSDVGEKLCEIKVIGDDADE